MERNKEEEKGEKGRARGEVRRQTEEKAIRRKDSRSNHMARDVTHAENLHQFIELLLRIG